MHLGGLSGQFLPLCQELICVVSGMDYGLSVSTWPVATKTLISHSQLASPTHQGRVKGKESGRKSTICEDTESIFFSVFFFSFFGGEAGNGMQQLDVGSQFPDQGLNPGHSGESTES